MSVVVHGLLFIGWFAVLLIALVYFPVLVFFGRDNPGTTMLDHLFALSIPPLAVVLMSLACWLAHRLWRSPRFKPAGFGLACALAAIGVWLGLHLRPH